MSDRSQCRLFISDSLAGRVQPQLLVKLRVLVYRHQIGVGIAWKGILDNRADHLGRLCHRLLALDCVLAARAFRSAGASALAATHALIPLIEFD